MQIGSKNNKLTSLTLTEYGDEMRHVHAALREWLSKCAPLMSHIDSDNNKKQMQTIMNICQYEV